MSDGDDAAGGRRPKRRCAARQPAANEALYVGYVEDNETPEMIMKKFEALEQVWWRAGGGGRGGGRARGLSDAARGAARRRRVPRRFTTRRKRIAHMPRRPTDGPPSLQVMGAAPATTCSAADAAFAPAADAATAPPNGGGLTDAQLKAVFKATSSFRVDAALFDSDAGTPDWLSSDDGGAGGDDDEPLTGFWSDGDEDDEARERRARPRDRRRAGGGAPKAPRPAAPRSRVEAAAAQRMHMVTQGSGSQVGTGRGGEARGGAAPRATPRPRPTMKNPSQALIRRRVRAVDRDALFTLRIPRPLPLSWGRVVRPWAPPAATPVAAAPDAADTAPPAPGAGLAIACDVVAACRARKGALGAPFQCVLINAGWDAGGAPPPHAGPASLPTLARLNLPALVPSGYAFAWAAKEALAGVTAQMDAWGFSYVENLTWVVLAPSHGLVAAPSALVARSHATLMIYRRGGADVELRHQRSPDVVFDCARRCAAPPGVLTPPVVYDTIETMLPGATAGRALELWAGEGQGARPGWTRLVQRVEG
jgi:N6-adenosine-specific RNA methylase IME4